MTADGRSGSAGARMSTNNRMELRAVIELLEAIPAREPLLVEADSEYVVKTVTLWLETWRKRGMRTASGRPVANQDLITRLDHLVSGRDVTFRWVRGHAGHPLNEAADALANAAARRAAARLTDEGPTPEPSART